MAYDEFGEKNRTEPPRPKAFARFLRCESTPRIMYGLEYLGIPEPKIEWMMRRAVKWDLKERNEFICPELTADIMKEFEDRKHRFAKLVSKMGFEAAFKAIGLQKSEINEIMTIMNNAVKEGRRDIHVVRGQGPCTH